MYYYVARWYDPAIGRFIQADTIVPNPASAKAFDRYAYAYNNPLYYTDPSGHVAIGANDNEVCLPGSYCDPLNIEDETVVFGGSYPGSPDSAGPELPKQVNMWIEGVDEDYWIQYPGSGYENEIYYKAKARQAVQALAKDLPYFIKLVCYSGGADACLMFAQEFDGYITDMVLIGPTNSGTMADGSDLGGSWKDIITDLVNGGTNVLLIDDSPQYSDAGGWRPTINPDVVMPGVYGYGGPQPCHYAGPKSDCSTTIGSNTDPGLFDAVQLWLANPIPDFLYRP